jgi:hypothetical protein
LKSAPGDPRGYGPYETAENPPTPRDESGTRET